MKKILIATPKERACDLADLLINKGFAAEAIPVMEFVPPEDPELIEQDLVLINSEDILIFISPQSAKAYLNIRNNFPSKNIYAIGEGTADILLKALLEPGNPKIIYPKDPGQFNGLGLLDLITQENKNWQGRKVFILRGGEGNKNLQEGLEKLGALVKNIEIYQRQPVLENYELLQAVLTETDSEKKIDLIILTSLQMAKYLFELWNKKGEKTWPKNIAVSSTSDAMTLFLEAHGVGEILRLRSMSNVRIVAQLCEFYKGNFDETASE